MIFTIFSIYISKTFPYLLCCTQYFKGFEGSQGLLLISVRKYKNPLIINIIEELIIKIFLIYLIKKFIFFFLYTINGNT